MELIYILREIKNDEDFNELITGELIFENKSDLLEVLKIIKNNTLKDYENVLWKDNSKGIMIITERGICEEDLLYKFMTPSGSTYEYYIISKPFYQSVLDYA